MKTFLIVKFAMNNFVWGICMNETMNVILTRRSIRKFSDKKISEEILKELVDAGMHAPSGMCRKTWKFTVISNQEVIKKLVEKIAKVLGRDDYDMYNPTALIIPSNHRESRWGKEDNACALQNIFLAAWSYGVGSVWINQLRNICDEPEIRNILREMEIPDDHVVYGLAALGYADETAPKPEYREIGDIKFIR